MNLWPIAIAIMVAAFLLCATFFILGRAWIRSQQPDPDDEPERAPMPRADDEEDDAEEERAAAFIAAVRTGNHDAIMLDLWREERRAEGLSDEEIDQILANRPTILVT
ncbi:MAG TPA: hypothetical protein VKZ85_03345 [Woeseiaceae bacterium]|nr:hypothetical protein [Woeseiaceae bacterium]